MGKAAKGATARWLVQKVRDAQLHRLSVCSTSHSAHCRAAKSANIDRRLLNKRLPLALDLLAEIGKCMDIGTHSALNQQPGNYHTLKRRFILYLLQRVTVSFRGGN